LYPQKEASEGGAILSVEKDVDRRDFQDEEEVQINREFLEQEQSQSNPAKSTFLGFYFKCKFKSTTLEASSMSFTH
jgi:hypothetical protein